MAATRQRIGDLFVHYGYVTREELNAALGVQQQTGQHLGEILVDQGKLSRLDLASALSAQWGVREPGSVEPASEPDQADRSVSEAVPLTLADRPSAVMVEKAAAPTAERPVGELETSRVLRSEETGELLLRLESQLTALSARHTTEMRNSQDAYRQLRDRLDQQQTELSTQYAAITDAIRAASAQTSVDTEGLERRIQEQLDQVQANLTELRQQVQTLTDRKPNIEPAALAEKKQKREKEKHR